MKKLLILLCVMIMVSGCATSTSMQMPVQECAHIDRTEGIVVGSVLMKGGKALLGHKSYRLVVKGMDPDLKNFSVDVKRDGNEVIFVTKMPAGQYCFTRLYPRFSNVYDPINVAFVVRPGQTVYIGRLLIEYPEGLITAHTYFSVSVEDAKDQTLASVEETHGNMMRDVVTDLMSQPGTTTIVIP